MEGWWEGQRREHARGAGREGILWGMTGESRETNGATQCACVELISSPSSPSIHHPLPTIPLHPPFTPLPLFRVPGVLAAPEESTESRGIWPRCLFALSILLPSPPFDHPFSLPRPSSTCTSTLLLISLHLSPHFFPSHSCYTFFSFLPVVFRLFNYLIFLFPAFVTNESKS